MGVVPYFFWALYVVLQMVYTRIGNERYWRRATPSSSTQLGMGVIPMPNSKQQSKRGKDAGELHVKHCERSLREIGGPFDLVTQSCHMCQCVTALH